MPDVWIWMTSQSLYLLVQSLGLLGFVSKGPGEDTIRVLIWELSTMHPVFKCKWILIHPSPTDCLYYCLLVIKSYHIKVGILHLKIVFGLVEDIITLPFLLKMREFLWHLDSEIRICDQHLLCSCRSWCSVWNVSMISMTIPFLGCATHSK